MLKVRRKLRDIVRTNTGLQTTPQKRRRLRNTIRVAVIRPDFLHRVLRDVRRTGARYFTDAHLTEAPKLFTDRTIEESLTDALSVTESDTEEQRVIMGPSTTFAVLTTGKVPHPLTDNTSPAPTSSSTESMQISSEMFWTKLAISREMIVRIGEGNETVLLVLSRLMLSAH
jgi:hypothetical protein